MGTLLVKVLIYPPITGSQVHATTIGKEGNNCFNQVKHQAVLFPL